MSNERPNANGIRSASLFWGGAMLALSLALAVLLYVQPPMANGARLAILIVSLLAGIVLMVGLQRSLSRQSIADTDTGSSHAKDEHEQMAQLFRMLPGCAWRTNDSLCYEEFFSDPGPLLGIDGQQLQGSPLWSWLHDESQRRRLQNELREAIGRRQPHLDLTVMVSGKRHPKWIGETLHLQYDEHGKFQFAIGFSHDITERKIREKELAAMQQHARKMEAAGTLVGGIAHEFNNMLAGMVGNVFLLKNDLKENPKQSERLERIETLIQRAARLIDQMLTFGRKHPAKMHRVSLDSIVRDFARIEKERLPSNIRFDVSIAEPVSVHADIVQIKQMLASLFQNAIDAVANQHEARIAIVLETIEASSSLHERHPQLETTGHLAHLMIRDDGCGIPRKFLNRVFDPFFTTKEVGAGTGMGLSMAYGIVDAMGGAIELDSTEGRGTTVHVYLPIADEKQQDWVREHSGDIFLGQGETLLLADDEELVREAASGVLRRLGYQVLAVGDGEAALNAVREQGDAIDLVVLDLIMPNMGGMEAAKEIRALRPDMPILFITGFDLNDTLDKRLHMEHADVVTKPFDVSELSRAIRRLLPD